MRRNRAMLISRSSSLIGKKVNDFQANPTAGLGPNCHKLTGHGVRKLSSASGTESASHNKTHTGSLTSLCGPTYSVGLDYEMKTLLAKWKRLVKWHKKHVAKNPNDLCNLNNWRRQKKHFQDLCGHKFKHLGDSLP